MDPKFGRICNSELITKGKFFCDFKKSGTVSFSDDKFKTYYEMKNQKLGHQIDIHKYFSNKRQTA